jgi:hypothetical protein
MELLVYCSIQIQTVLASPQPESRISPFSEFSIGVEQKSLFQDHLIIQ